MDIPVILSHRTAWLCHNVARNHIDTCRRATEIGDYSQIPEIGLSAPGIKASAAVECIVSFLESLGIPSSELRTIDTLHAFSFERQGTRLVRPHAFQHVVPSEHLIQVAIGLFVVDESMCFMQAGLWMGDLEQLEFGYELCADYHLDHVTGSGYVPSSRLTTVAELERFCRQYPSYRGSARALGILRRVKDASRSPMETAMAMMISAKRSLGGLGFCRFELNRRVDVVPGYRHLTKSGYFEIDLFVPRRNVGFEYNGSDHLERSRSAYDAERLAVLGIMGFDMIVMTGTQFANQLQMHRLMNTVAEVLKIKCDRSDEYQRRQNELRLFVIRTWKDEKS